MATTSKYAISKQKHELTSEQGAFLLKLARSTIKSHLMKETVKKPNSYDAIFNEPRGAFVTLHTKTGDLRGCIGYPEPVVPLIDAVIDSAKNAATQDPRFPPVTLGELSSLKLEITVLTKPERMTVKHPSQYIHDIRIGTDGLIVEQGFCRGLLLPQVAPEWEWDEREFLAHTCEKAGLAPDAWEDLDDTKIYKFQGQIFKE